MVEAEQPHVLLFGLFLELLYLQRLDEKAAAALFLVRVLGPPHVDDDFVPPLSIPTSAPAHSSGYASLAWSWICPKSPARILSGTYSSQKCSERYLSAPSQRMVTTVPDSISLATSSAVATAAPAERPMRIPSSRATRLTIS